MLTDNLARHGWLCRHVTPNLPEIPSFSAGRREQKWLGNAWSDGYKKHGSRDYPSTMPREDDNGLLSRMSAVEIGAALARLPDAATYPTDEIQQWSTVPSMGGLLLTFRRHRHKHGKAVPTFWVAVKAERAS